MPQLRWLSANRLKRLTKWVLIGMGLAMAPPAMPAPDDDGNGVEHQIEQALDASLADRIRQRYPSVEDDQYRAEYRLQSAVRTLQHCSATIEVDWRDQTLSGRQTPRVQCPSEGWQIYVPVTIEIRMPVVVSAGSLSRGQRLTESDLELSVRDIGSLRMGYFDSARDLVGYEIARNLNPGEVITAHLAEPPMMIEKGDRVVIIATGGGLSVRTQGEALRDGRSGRQIPVRNLNSRKIVHAYVKRPGVVEIPVQ